ncbi:MAG: M28 family peptidase, partial [Gemmatimonadaceae bacterium]
MITSVRRACILLALPIALPAMLYAQPAARPGQPVTISIQDAFNEQAHPPLPRTHPPQPTTPGITSADLMTRLFIFADDSMMGRETGTQGHVKATNYLASELKALGLKPAGDKGTYFQDLPVVLRMLDPKSTLSVSGKSYVAGKDFVASAGRGGGPIGHVGSGVVIYNGRTADTSSAALTVAQVSGKIVVNRAPVLGGGRGGNFGGRGNGLVRVNPLDSALAIINVVDSITMQQANAALNPTDKGVVFTGIPNTPAVPPTVTISAAMAQALFGSPIDAITRGTVGKSLTTNLKFIEQPKPARNVVAILPGSDSKFKNEYVAIGAHSDHVGYLASGPVDHDSVRLYNSALRTQGLEGQSRQPTEEQAKLLRTLLDSLHKLNGVRMDSINNGADDDGSGSVTLLEIAEAFAKAPVKPKRSIIFVWHVAEEKGLWGSDWFSRYPTVPRDSIVAQLNMDMVGRGKAEDIPLGGMDFIQPVGWRKLSNELGDMAEKLNTSQRVQFKYDLQYDAAFQLNNIYCRSDHANYARFGIPIVYFTTGLHRDYHQ